MNLDMLYSTYKERIYQLWDNIPSYQVNVTIVIVHQVSKGDVYNIDMILERKDIIYIPSYTTGVARSRNLAIENSKSDIVLFCDDDVQYKENIASEIIDVYKNNPRVKAITFAYEKEVTRGFHNFSTASFTHNLFSILSIGTIEISCLRSAIIQSKASFPDNLGAGEKYYLCDEPVFMSKLVKHYSREVMYFPLILGMHPEVSSGSSFNDMNAFKSRLLCFQYVFGKMLGSFLYNVFLLKNINKLHFGFYFKAFFLVYFYK